MALPSREQATSISIASVIIVEKMMFSCLTQPEWPTGDYTGKLKPQNTFCAGVAAGETRRATECDHSESRST
jgi:hypothetical protein